MFFFVARRSTVQLELEKPLDCCCNCGSTADDISLVETNLQITRFYFVFGTELNLLEEFPYCRSCRRSARRVRPGMLSKLLMACLATAVFFFVLVMAESVLTPGMRESPFRWSLGLGFATMFAWFTLQGRRRTPRSYYQPVRVREVDLKEGRLRLEFTNPEYRELFATANAGLVARGFLQVQAA